MCRTDVKWPQYICLNLIRLLINTSGSIIILPAAEIYGFMAHFIAYFLLATKPVSVLKMWHNCVSYRLMELHEMRWMLHRARDLSVLLQVPLVFFLSLQRWLNASVMVCKHAFITVFISKSIIIVYWPIRNIDTFPLPAVVESYEGVTENIIKQINTVRIL